MDDLKAPKQTRGWDWRRGRHTAVIGIPLIWLLAVALILGIKFAFAASPASPPSSPSPCVSYLTVARDLHVLQLWGLEDYPQDLLEAWQAWGNIQTDNYMMQVMHMVTTYDNHESKLAWERLWILRYSDCLTELGGR